MPESKTQPDWERYIQCYAFRDEGIGYLVKRRVPVDQATDLVDRAILQTAKSGLDLPTLVSIRGCFFTILRRRLIDDLRSGRRQADGLRLLQLAYFDEANRMGLEIEREIDAEKVRQAIDRLPHELRRVIDLYFRQGLTMAEVSKRCGCCRQTVSKRRDRALAELRGILLGRPQK